ncbi:MAG: substrate-binding domain-containing protein [Lachnospiraceae bacterium]|nr:substrate-binding domain-containing protein [Lachnospiraceae bacterium]
MKKLLAMLLTATMVVSLTACGGSSASTSSDSSGTAAEEETGTETEDAEVAETSDAAGGTIYVLGPTPDHGWTAQAGVYAQEKVDEIVAAGKYNAVYMGANDAEEQVDQISTVIANGDAVGVVIYARDYGTATGELQLSEAGIPWIAFDRVIEETQDYSILNASGDNWQAGAAIAKYLQE